MDDGWELAELEDAEAVRWRNVSMEVVDFRKKQLYFDVKQK